MRTVTTAAAVMLCLGAWVPAFAQTPQRPPSPETFRAGVNLVEVDVSVRSPSKGSFNSSWGGHHRCLREWPRRSDAAA